MSGTLTLIPTPIADNLPLEPNAKGLLEENAQSENIILLVEELKIARRMWASFGLARDAFSKFEEFNEHTQEKAAPKVIAQLKSGKSVFLLSDCGLPAFCDPGQKLVDLCHRNKIKVTATPFPNSIALAIALSGFDSSEFFFAGFISNKSDQRRVDLKRLAVKKETTVVMDTPYRFNKIFSEFLDICPGREVFLGTNLNAENEQLYRGTFKELSSKITKLKCEFIMILGPLK